MADSVKKKTVWLVETAKKKWIYFVDVASYDEPIYEPRETYDIQKAERFTEDGARAHVVRNPLKLRAVEFFHTSILRRK